MTENALDRITGPGKVSISLCVNGETHTVEVEPRRTLLDTLRVNLGLTGTKKGCDMGECGACTILVDGKPMYSCLLLAVECEGKRIMTVEGLSSGDKLDPVQQAFAEYQGFECGFCTPGQEMAVKGLLEASTTPTPEEIQRSVSGNICRCGQYRRIFKAASAAAEVYEAASTRSG